MTELSKRPTPESDAFAEHLFVGAPAQSARFPTNTEWLAFARSLEQRLGAVTEALENIVASHDLHCEDHVGVSHHSHALDRIAREALAAIKEAK